MLKGPVGRVAAICTGRSPSLKYLRMNLTVAIDIYLDLTGSDGEVFVDERVSMLLGKASGCEPGECVVLASSLTAFLKGLDPQEAVSAHQDGNRLVLRAPHAGKRAVAPSMNQRDFPGVPNAVPDALFGIEQSRLREILRLCVFCVDQMKAADAGIFCGVHFSLAAGKLTVVATERGNRASVFDAVDVVSTFEPKQGCPAEAEFVLTRKAVLTLKQHLRDSGSAVFAANPQHTTIMVTMGDLTLLLPTLAGQFPQVAPLVREKLTARFGYDDTSHAHVDAKDFAARMMQVRDVAAHNADDGMRCTMRVGDGAVKFGATNNLGAEQFEKIACATTGPTIDVCCNAKYLQEALGAVGDCFVELYVVPPNKYLGLCVERQGTVLDNYVHMILPLRD